MSYEEAKVDAGDLLDSMISNALKHKEDINDVYNNYKAIIFKDTLSEYESSCLAYFITREYERRKANQEKHTDAGNR